MSLHKKYREPANPLGVHPINWSNDDFQDLGGDIPLETCFRQMREAGYHGTEVGNKYPKNPDALRPVMDRFQLRLAGGWHSTFLAEKPFEAEEKRFRAYLNFLKAMDASVIILAECGQAIHGDETQPLKFGPDLIGLYPDQWKRVYAGLDRLSEQALAAGLTPVYHHHLGTVVQSESALDNLMAQTNQLQLLFDTGHLAFAGMDPAVILDRYIGRVGHVHLKNIRPRVVRQVRKEGFSFGQAVRAGVFTVPGDEEANEPAVNYPPLLDKLADHGYRGWFVVEAEQDPVKADPLDYARKARNYLKTIAGL